MQISRADVADLIYFMAIARHRSFSRAAIELGVSASALSHALKGLETRLGVRLLNRTTKSVTPTAAGEELVQSVLQPFDTIEGALESLNRYRNTPTGRIRINAAVEAANLLLAPVMPAFMDRYPDIEIDIVASNRMVDVTDAGFDAGIRYGGTVPEDMVARRLSADIRWVIAASPDYLERYGTPEHPDDLLHHRCISNRLGDDRVYRWELARDGETYQMTVPGSVTVNHAETGLVVPELAMLQSFSSGPTLPGGSPTKNPARFAPAGFGIRVVPDPTAHCRRRPPQTRRPPRLARFLVGSKRSGLRSLGTCCVEK